MSESPHQIIDRAIDEFRPSKIFCLFSGGNDSLATTHLAANYLGEKMTAVVHLNTGIGIPQTRQFVRETCEQFSWPLIELKAIENVNAKGDPDPQDYEELVCRLGFPGPHGHKMMYSRLKERSLRRLLRDHKNSLLLSGLRKQESSKRMRLKNPIQEFQGQQWCNPAFFLSKREILEYRRKHNLPKNEVCDLLHMSGECLCGAFAHPGELKEIELWFPDVAAHIKRIEEKVKAAGFPWGWEDAPPKWWSKMREAEKYGQSDAFEIERDEVLVADGFQPLCAACNKRAE